MIKLDIKPLSVNQAWQGKRFKTPKYKNYEREMLLILPKIQIGIPPYKLKIEFGFSSKLSDIDNPVKMFLDCLVKKYGFDDRDIYQINVEKYIVPKGNEYIKFELNEK